jgi:DNA-binding MarR family transcriptional regulator
MRSSARDVATALVEFMPRFNDKLASLFPSRAEAVESLTKSQVRVLMLLGKRSGATATELGEGLNMTKANLTGILDELEAKGLAQRATDPKDRRKSLLDLTARGRKTADAIALEFEKALEARIGPLTDQDRAALARSLAAASAILDRI